jgi:Glycosyl transferase family 90
MRLYIPKLVTQVASLVLAVSSIILIQEQKYVLAAEGGLRNSDYDATTSTAVSTYVSIEQRMRVANDYTNPKTLSEYFERAGLLNHVLLLMWDSNGNLIRVSHVSHKEWFPENGFNADKDWHPDNARDISSHVPASPNGRIALLLNDDVVASIDWSINPPIPFMAYTLPATVWENKRFLLTPTPYDMYGFNRFCITLVDAVKTPFSQRKPVIIWRGETHGMSDMNRFLLIKLSEKNRDWLDARSTLKDHSLRLERVEMSEYRYQLDIGGESGTTWGGLLWKMCSGSLIFKVDTFAKDWWHDLLVPWVHYIPIEELVSDLPDRYQWVATHQEEAEKIAMAGQQLCRTISEDKYVWNFHQDILNKIDPATPEQVQEVNGILDGTISGGQKWSFE